MGICIFIIAELITFAYVQIVMKSVPCGSSWSPTNEFVGLSTKVVYWICRPFSSILRIFFRSFVKGLLKIYIVNIAGWIAISIFILSLKNKDKTA